MAPILSFLISSAPKKKELRYVCPSEAKAENLNDLRVQERNPDILFFSFSKVPANEPPPGSPTGHLWRGRPVYRAFCVSLKNLVFRVPQ
jgi:hypothetical protein